MPANPTIIRSLLTATAVSQLRNDLEKWIAAASHAPTEQQRFSFARYQLFTPDTEGALRESGVADMPPALNALRQSARTKLKADSSWSAAVVTICPTEHDEQGPWAPLGIPGFEKVAAVHVALSPYRIQFRFGRRIESVFSLSAGDAVTMPLRGIWEFRADETRGERLSVDLLDLPGPFADGPMY